jgi:hypothetical protein
VNGLEAITAERRRQIELGYDAGHDASHGLGQLMEAAAAVLDNEQDRWPWPDGWPDDRSVRESLVVAAALIVAAIDVVDATGVPCPSCGETAVPGFIPVVGGGTHRHPDFPGVEFARCPSCVDGRVTSGERAYNKEGT